MLTLALAAGVLFCLGVLRDPRSFSNAVLLGLCLALGALGSVEHVVGSSHRVAVRLLVLCLALLLALAPFLVAVYLVMNGIIMARRESIRPANMLSLLAGLAIFGLAGLMVVTLYVRDTELTFFSGVTFLLSGYISFLLISYVLYAVVYGKLTALRRADFVVVLGSGLAGGERVPPLLASRLDRGRQVYEALLMRRKSTPMVIVSGGKGEDELLSEAEAMARYLTEHGVPGDRVIREERSRTTEENLTFSKAIMERFLPRYRCIIVTSNYHVFRAAILARTIGVNGQVTGARTAGYYWPSAMLREFAAVFLRYKLINLGICLLIVVLPLVYFAFRRFLDAVDRAPRSRQVHPVQPGQHHGLELGARLIIRVTAPGRVLQDHLGHRQPGDALPHLLQLRTQNLAPAVPVRCGEQFPQLLQAEPGVLPDHDLRHPGQVGWTVYPPPRRPPPRAEQSHVLPVPQHMRGQSETGRELPDRVLRCWLRVHVHPDISRFDFRST